MKRYIGIYDDERSIVLDFHITHGRIILSLHRKHGYKMGSMNISCCIDELIHELQVLQEARRDIMSLALGVFFDHEHHSCNTLEYWKTMRERST